MEEGSLTEPCTLRIMLFSNNFHPSATVSGSMYSCELNAAPASLGHSCTELSKSSSVKWFSRPACVVKHVFIYAARNCYRSDGTARPRFTWHRAQDCFVDVLGVERGSCTAGRVAVKQVAEVGGHDGLEGYAS